jgi:hypothetical protein
MKGGVGLLLARLDPSLINKTKNPISDLVLKFYFIFLNFNCHSNSENQSWIKFGFYQLKPESTILTLQNPDHQNRFWFLSQEDTWSRIILNWPSKIRSFVV